MSQTISITATVFNPHTQEERCGVAELELPEGVTPKEFLEILLGNVVEENDGIYYAEKVVAGPEGEKWTYAAHLKDAA